MAGILSYGSYVPFFRLDRKSFGGGRGERAVASYDEDAVSMAVEAAREALRALADSSAIDTLLFATTSPPYAEKLNAAAIHAALDLSPSVLSAELGSSTRAGLSALKIAAGLATSGQTVLAALSDVVVGAPSGPRESGGGDAAAAFLLGSDDEALARVVGGAAATDEMLDVWRTSAMPFARQWEERFGADLLVPLLADVVKRSLDDSGSALDQISTVILDSTNARAARTVLGKLGLAPEKIAEDLSATVGRAGAAQAGLLLANTLDKASPGDRILVVCGADGAEGLVLEVTDRINDRRPRHSVAQWVGSKRADLAYTTYLKWRGILPFEPPRRPDPARPAAPPMHRAERWKYAFVGSRCEECGSGNLPPQRVCVVCQAVDKMKPEPYAEASCKIATYTLDHLAYSLQPPVVAAVLDFDKGGRFACQLTDVDPEAVGIGDELEMTFRLIYTAEGVHNYFWKGRPKR